jgi:hypothetical protein
VVVVVVVVLLLLLEVVAVCHPPLLPWLMSIRTGLEFPLPLLVSCRMEARGLQQLRISSTYRTMHIKPYYTIPDPHTLVAFSRPREPTESGCLQKAVA